MITRKLNSQKVESTNVLNKRFIFTPWAVCSASASSASLIFISFRCFSICPRSLCNTWKSDVVEFEAASSLHVTEAVIVFAVFKSLLGTDNFCNRRFSSCKLLTSVTNSFDSARHCSSINSSSWKYRKNWMKMRFCCLSTNFKFKLFDIKCSLFLIVVTFSHKF